MAKTAEPDDENIADARLRKLLVAQPPASVLALPEADRTALAEVLADGHRAQARSLEQAFTAALKHVPFPVCGIVKKMLTG